MYTLEDRCVWHKRACGYTICLYDKKCKCWFFCIVAIAAANEEISIHDRERERKGERESYKNRQA